MDVLTKAQRRKNMQAIRSKDTKMERVFATALWAQGFRYRKNDKTVFGKPDLTFKKYKIAIFIDSEFFHGKDWEKNKQRIQTNQQFWWKKIEGNMARDRLVINTLNNAGWKVIRFWTEEIRKNLANCIIIIEKTLEERKCQKNIPR
jgi:DNA mismatch endonuclease (patch repair protein)